MECLRFDICVTDAQLNILYVNQAFMKRIGAGFDREVYYKTNFHDLSKRFEKSRRNFDLLLKALKEKKEIRVVRKATPPRGKSVRVLSTACPIMDKHGNIKYLVAASIPIQYILEMFQTGISEAEDEEPFYRISSLSETGFVFESTRIKRLIADAERVAQTDSSVLVSGESGTGKEIIACHIHKYSKRNSKPFVIVNCTTIPENLLESELFGYEKGAFTGAIQGGKPGLLETANGGTLFLDEINSMPLSLQGKMLRVLETKQIQRLGSVKNQQIDFRLIAATNQDLKELVTQGEFRADLFYRINVIPLRVPPLRERIADILPLCNHFIVEFSKKYNVDKILSRRVLNQLLQYSWPGNVRELKNFIERLVVMSNEGLVVNRIPDEMLEDLGMPRDDSDKNTQFESVALPFDYDNKDFSFRAYMDYCEELILRDALSKFDTAAGAARALRLHPSNVMRKKEKYGVL